jgi:hypothetical protein
MSITGELKPPLTLEQLVTIFRQRVDDLPGDVVDKTTPWQNDDTGLLWSNDEACTYADEAQQELFLRRHKKDSTTVAVTQITVAIGTATYAFDKRILAIERVKFVDSAADEFVLDKTTHQTLDFQRTNWQKDGNGVVDEYIEDFEDRSITLYRTPKLAGTLFLTVRRLPLAHLSWVLRHKLLEAADENQFDLLDWMMFRAYLKRDAETENPDLAGTHKSLFDERVGERPSAHLQQVRRQERNIDRRVRTHFF